MEFAKIIGSFDAHDIFGLLVPQLPLYAQPDGCSVFFGQGPSIHAPSQYGLRMKSVDQVYRFIVGPRAVNIGAMKHDVFGAWRQSGLLKQEAKRGALPAGNGAPPFDTIMPRDLGT